MEQAVNTLEKRNYLEKDWYKNIQLCLSKSVHYFLKYDKKEEIDIINKMSEWSNMFVLISAKKINITSDNKKTLDINSGNIKLLLEKIFNNDGSLEKIYENYCTDSQSTNYLYFAYIPNLAKERMTRTVSDYLYKLMLKNVQYSYYYSEYFLHNSRAIVKFSDNKADQILHPSDDGYDKNNVVTLPGGIGDFFILFSQIHDFIIRTKENTKLYMPIVSYQRKYKYMVEMCFPGVFEYIVFDNQIMRNFWLNSIRNDFMNKFNRVFTDNKKHITELFANVLGTDKNLYIYKHSDILSDLIYKNILEEELEYIESITKNSNCIGLQFYTGYFNTAENKWVDDKVRNWGIDNARKFTEICAENNIKVIILNPHDFGEIEKAVQLKNISVAGYAYLISKLNFHVGIDSSAGHIASFYDIPSITLWGHSQLCMPQGEKVSVGYRRLRKNYSIISRHNDVSKIPAEMVSELFIKLQNDRLLDNENRIISYEDSINDYYTIYI